MVLPAGGAAAVAGAPPATVYHQCSPDQWDAWYTLVTGLGDGAEPFELLVTLAQELRNEGVPFAEKWGESPNALQLGRLRVQLRQADIRIDDILTDEHRYKGKKAEWWFIEGAKYTDRLLNKFRPRVRDYLSPEMMAGTMLSPTECQAVVEDPLFDVTKRCPLGVVLAVLYHLGVVLVGTV
jgi:hypothetical protein